jgi:predicted ester cyclase
MLGCCPKRSRKAILRGTFTGVLYSDAGDIPPTGRTVELHVCEVFEIRNRKITRHATYYDALGFMQRLGVLPTPG